MNGEVTKLVKWRNVGIISELTKLCNRVFMKMTSYKGQKKAIIDTALKLNKHQPINTRMTCVLPMALTTAAPFVILMVSM